MRLLLASIANIMLILFQAPASLVSARPTEKTFGNLKDDDANPNVPIEDESYWNRLLQQTEGSIQSTPPTLAPTNVPITPPPTNLPTSIPTFIPTLSPTTTSCTNILWSDEFNTGKTSIDESAWSYELGMGEGGFGNLELQTYTSNPANVRVENGNLVITALEETTDNGERTFTSGRINTQDKVEVLYGNVEARIKIPNLANGLWPAFWTLGGNFRQVGWPFCGEIDILEMGSNAAIDDGVVNRRVVSGAFWENEGARAEFGGSFDNPTDLNDGEFHIFRMEWTPTRIATFVDDNEIWFIDIGLDVCTDCTEFHQPHYLLLNLAVGGIFTGILDAEGITASFPAEYVVDYVRVCDNGDTVVSGLVFEEPVEYSFSFDCGAPDSCTNDALNNYAGEFKCGDRIQFLIGTGLDETEACRQIAGSEFPEVCGVCIPQVINCDFPEMCNDSVLDTDADGFSCRDRIAFLVGINGETEQEACNTVAAKEFPAQCGNCAKIDCDMPEVCTDQALDSDTAGVPCRDRIRFLIGTGVPELEACQRVAGIEFSESGCGVCSPPIECGVDSNVCNDDILDMDADGLTCRERILFLIGTGLSEVEACRQVAGDEFPTQCGACNPPTDTALDCGIPDACTDEILDMDANGFTCRERIVFLIGTGLDEADACRQIAGDEFPEACGACNPPTDTALDCGLPDTCTDEVLDMDADGFTCRERIVFLIGTGLDEADACRQIAGDEFPEACGACNPPTDTALDCGLPGACTDEVLDMDADGFTCRERIVFLIGTGLDETDACRQIAGDEFPEACGACNPPTDTALDCGLPGVCTDEVLDMDADGFTCRERIVFLIGTGLDEADACRQIAGDEFPEACGACNPL